MFTKTKTTCFKCKASKTYLRKSCDLASTRSVSIPSGCRGSPERSDAMARITVASSSLYIEHKRDVRVRAFSNFMTTSSLECPQVWNKGAIALA